MDELLRTNDPVLISFVSSLLSEANISFIVADANMSVLEGSLGVLPRRVLIDAETYPRARQILEEAGIGDKITVAQDAAHDAARPLHPGGLNVGKI